MGSRRNRRVDFLVHLLITDVHAYFVKKEARQEAGFDGLSLLEQEQRKVFVAATGLSEEVRSIPDLASHFTVQDFLVDISTPWCTCEDFPYLTYCLHYAAVQHHLGLSYEVVPSRSPMAPPLPTLSPREDSEEGPESVTAEPSTTDKVRILRDISTRSASLANSAAAGTHLSPPIEDLRSILCSLGPSSSLPPPIPLAPNTKTPNDFRTSFPHSQLPSIKNNAHKNRENVALGRKQKKARLA